MSFNPWTEPHWKKGKTALRLAKRQRRAKTVKRERDTSTDVRRRDRVCRFPRCGCRRLQLVLKSFAEVSHDKHRGIGGNPGGDRAATANKVLLCKHRHQDGVISRHKGTLRAIYLTDRGYDGPVRWEIDAAALERQLLPAQERGPLRDAQWRPIWIETAPGIGAPPDDWADEVLNELEYMEV